MISLERQEEYELRQVLFSEMNKDIDNNFQGVYDKITHDFGKEILYPLSVVEKKFNVDVVEKLMRIYKAKIKFSPSKVSPYITVKISNDFEILKECKQFLNYI